MTGRGSQSLAYLDPNSADLANTWFSAMPVNPFLLQPLPSFPLAVPLSERSYQFGSSNPIPAQNPQRLYLFLDGTLPSPDPIHKQWRDRERHPFLLLQIRPLHSRLPQRARAEQSFFSGNPYLSVRIPELEILGHARARANEFFVPAVYVGPYYAGDAYNPSATPSIQNAVPQIGDIGIGQFSGTVFRQGIYVPIATLILRASRLPSVDGGQIHVLTDTTSNWGNPLAFSPYPADPLVSAGVPSTSASPLIYVYQTTISE